MFDVLQCTNTDVFYQVLSKFVACVVDCPAKNNENFQNPEVLTTCMYASTQYELGSCSIATVCETHRQHQATHNYNATHLCLSLGIPLTTKAKIVTTSTCRFQHNKELNTFH